MSDSQRSSIAFRLRPWVRGLAPWWAGALTLLAVSSDAEAYTISSIATKGCHEMISADALRAARAQLATAAPLPSTGADDTALIDDVAFSLPSDLGDIGGATLLLGVRDNDLKNVSSTAIDSLAQLNSDPVGQREHCLRTEAQKEPSGSKEAIDDCRKFIHDTLLASLAGLGADGAPDPNIRETLDVSLGIRGRVHVDVPMFYLRAGRALHAIEDSFTHTFRSKADRHKITVVLNWINYATNTLNESTDGPPHISGMDRCDDPDELLTERHAMAVAATSEALLAVLDPKLGPGEKEAAINTMLDKYISYDATAGCTAANNWCDAAENAYRPSGCGCGVAGARGERAVWLGAFAALLAAALRLGGRRRRRVGALLPLGVLAAGSLAARPSLGAPPEPHATAAPPATAPPAASSPPVIQPPNAPKGGEVPQDAPTHEAKGPIAALTGDSKAATPGTEDPGGSLFGRVSLGFSYNNPGFSGGLGARYQLGRPWMVGLDAEWNPFMETNPTRVRSGVANFYASLIRRYQMAYERVNFRTTASLGASYLLFDLVGAPKGSIGPYLGLSFLGVEFKVARGFFLTVDPTYIAFPVPHLTGAPFGYYQYRFQVGLEFGG